jgi:sulfur-oxidizing protein SoxY
MERRKFIKDIITVSAVTATIPNSLMAEQSMKGSNDLSYEDAVKVIVGDKGVNESSKVKLRVPLIAENGAVVPVKVVVESPMNEKNYVRSVHILNTENSNARCADMMLTSKNAEAKLSLRIKLAKSQDVVAIVGLSDGTFIKATKSVKVTIGGCG